MDDLTWESFASMLDSVTTAGLELGHSANRLAPARAAYFQLTGQPVAEETGFEHRDQGFYEFFVFDYRPDENTPPVGTELVARGGDVAAAAVALESWRFLAGSVKKTEATAIEVSSWRASESLLVSVPSGAGFSRHDGVAARCFRIGDAWFASPATEVVHADLAGELKRQLKWLASVETTDRDMWAATLRFQLVASRYSAAKPKEIVERWLSLEQTRGSI